MRSLAVAATFLALAACMPVPQGTTGTQSATAALAPPLAAAAGPVSDRPPSERKERPIVMRIRGLHGMTNRANRSVRKELERALAARGVRITRRPTGWTHELRGRFTSLNEARATSIAYVYDIAPAGRAASIRVTGFERSAGSSSDPWGGVGGAFARRLALRSTERILERLR